ncbi:unnamed protein product [Polarella glacialis]|uniref:Radical SAM core domain-containing protein n=1 Tax=Polarella glacialis TaxID=89957 RepID=A0A813EDU6_POLGL|nr:unnamed protein product [Polarella glacialis]
MAPAGPKRLRRPAASQEAGTQISIWDAAAGGLLKEMGVKPSHVLPLMRALVAHIIEGSGSCAKAPCGSEAAKQPSAEEAWAALGVSEASLVDLGFLPRKAAAELLKTLAPFSTKLAAEPLMSADGSTSKFLVELRDGHKVETVVMRHEQRTTICVSSQVGCQMGCTFCATGTLPVVGDLDAGEIVEQLIHAHALEAKAGRPPVRNAVFMGMGEPLNNYNSVLSATRTMTDVGHLGKFALPPARVTISTVGIVPRIRQLADDLPAVNLALSLHAPTQELRTKIVPAARHHSMEELMAALDAYAAKCNKPMAHLLAK